MIKIILIDTEVDALNALESKIRKYKSDEEINIIKCNFALDGLNLIREIEPDIVFLDVQLLEVDGFAFLSNFTSRTFEVVLTTTHYEHGIKAVKANVLDYLLKPIDINELQLTLAKAEKQFFLKKEQKKIPNKINIAADGRVYLIARENVVYLKADKSYTTIFLTSAKKIVVTKTLKEVQKKFTYSEFYRVHNSYVINLNHVTEYNKGLSELKLIDGTIVSVSRRKKNELIEKLQLDK
ncbi:MAG: LytR/AlgR family response regulator transcription factor [Tenacibaculum sp.]